jgi:biotin-(acetyl-CoA carboxylase) ligase
LALVGIKIDIKVNTQKKELKNIFLGRIPALVPELSEGTRQKLCKELAEDANSYCSDLNKEVGALLRENIAELESTRGYLVNFITHLENSSKKIINNLTDKGMIWLENDKQGKSRMMARTEVLGMTVEYFNEINKLVKEYYQSIAPVPLPDKPVDNPESTHAASIFRQGKLF